MGNLSSTFPEKSKYTQPTLDANILNVDRLKAEVDWTIFATVKGYSNNSAQGLNEVFATVQQFQLGPDKLKYLTNWGIAPHFKDLLETKLLKSDYVVVSFDGSLNERTQNCQKDIVVRFWNPGENRVEVRYWDSQFLGHAAHMDILEHFNKSIEKIDPSKVIQVSMDGPSVNLKFYDKLVKFRQECELPQLINIGICGLHVNHGALKTGIED